MIWVRGSLLWEYAESGSRKISTTGYSHHLPTRSWGLIDIGIDIDFNIELSLL